MAAAACACGCPPAGPGHSRSPAPSVTCNQPPADQPLHATTEERQGYVIGYKYGLSYGHNFAVSNAAGPYPGSEQAGDLCSSDLMRNYAVWPPYYSTSVSSSESADYYSGFVAGCMKGWSEGPRANIPAYMPPAAVNGDH